jgi:hypothetical protein
VDLENPGKSDKRLDVTKAKLIKNLIIKYLKIKNANYLG